MGGAETELAGVYNFEWSGGKFEVHFRPGGYFFAPLYQADAHWTIEGDTVLIEWGKVRDGIITIRSASCA
eukprot:scaffold4521_cov388-Prasinococcus_capsulatus_cf.AAC.14